MTPALQNAQNGKAEFGEIVPRVLLVAYWVTLAIFGYWGLTLEAPYSILWVFAEAFGLLCSVLVALRYRTLHDYVSALGLVYCAWILYVNTFYVVYLYIDVTRFINISEQVVNRSFYICLISTATFGAFFETYRHTSQEATDNSPQASRPVDQHDFSWLSVLLVALCSLYYVCNFFRSGAAELVGSVDRLTLANTIETGKIWLVNYVMTGFTLCTVYGLSRPGQKLGVKFLIVILFVAAFWGIYLLTGNRRGLISVFIATYVVLVWRKKLNPQLTVLGIAFVIFAGLFAQFRQTGTFSVNDGDVVNFVFNVLGEFIFPQVTLLYTVEESPPLLLGGSYFAWLSGMLGTYFGFPRYLFMSQEFALQIAPPGATEYMGYAFMPLTEAYLNFGAAGSILAPIMLGLSILLIQRIFSARSMAALVLMAIALDINRGEFGAIAVQFAIIYAAAALLSASTHFVLRGRSIDCISRRKTSW